MHGEDNIEVNNINCQLALSTHRNALPFILAKTLVYKGRQAHASFIHLTATTESVSSNMFVRGRTAAKYYNWIYISAIIRIFQTTSHPETNA